MSDETWSGWEQHVTSDGYVYWTYDQENHTVPYQLSTLSQLGQLANAQNMTPREYVAERDRTEKRDLKPGTPDHTSEKAPMHALPLTKLETLARVLEYGNLKYARDNWIGTANDPARYIGAILRHLSAIQRGEMIDESGLPHVGHLQASALILEEALRNAGLLK